MRIDVRKRWRCLTWVGPNGEAGCGLWLPIEEFVQDDAWCAHMDTLYPGWKHAIAEQRGTPRDNHPEGWVEHPLYGNMETGPLGL